MKKKILFIADKPNWAYHFIIKTWAELLPEYDCFVAFAQDFSIKAKQFGFIDIIKSKINLWINKKEILYRISKKRNYSFPIYKNPPVYNVLTNEKANITHFDCIVEMAYYFQYTSVFPFTATKKIVGLYTDSFPHEGPSFDAKNNIELKNLNRKEFYDSYLKSYDGIVVGNQNLFNDYHKFTDKLFFANGIYLQDLFVENLNVGKKTHLTIGWTGTPDREMKGFRSIIEPAIKKVQETGRDIRLKTKFSGDYKELLTFYQDVDLIVIASNADTGPSLFSEASLSNVPSISTKIGFPKMIIKNGENGIFIQRNIDEMANAIIELYDNREKLILFSKRIKKDYLDKLGNEISIGNLRCFINKNI